jgi:hypothetical protein
LDDDIGSSEWLAVVSTISVRSFLVSKGSSDGHRIRWLGIPDHRREPGRLWALLIAVPGFVRPYGLHQKSLSPDEGVD